MEEELDALGDGAVIVREMRGNEVSAALGIGYSVTIRVEDADAHCKRQYDADDLAGHSWTFSQSVADEHPGEWGGTAQQL